MAVHPSAAVAIMRPHLPALDQFAELVVASSGSELDLGESMWPDRGGCGRARGTGGRRALAPRWRRWDSSRRPFRPRLGVGRGRRRTVPSILDTRLSVFQDTQ
jgi:hypothetical protein